MWCRIQLSFPVYAPLEKTPFFIVKYFVFSDAEIKAKLHR